MMIKRFKLVVVISLAVLLLSVQTSFTFAHASQSHDEQLISATARMKPAYVPGRVLIKYKSGVSQQRRNNLMMAGGMREFGDASPAGLRVAELPEGTDVESYAAALNSLPEVEFAEPDYICYPVSSMVPDDPLYSSQWHLQAVSCPPAWAMTAGSDQITIALCDTGMDAIHPDLAPKVVPGWNIADNNSDTTPVSSHGTWTAGTAAATGNNSIGVASPALNCRIMPVRVSSVPSGAALISNLVAGAMWAADHGARVVSMSYMAGGSSAMADAGRYIQSKGGVLIVAAGNTATYNSAPDSSSMIVVSATNQTDGLAGFTTTGAYVDLSAPGVGIMTTAPGNNYQQVNGTSFSTPLVAGAAALLWSLNPSLTPEQVDTILKVTSDDFGPAGWDPGYGWGRLNIGRAIDSVHAMLVGAADATPPAIGFAQPQIVGATNGVAGISKGELVRVNALDDRNVSEVTLFADGSPVGSVTAAPYDFSWNTSMFADGSQHTLTAVATDNSGNTTTVSTTVTLTAGFDATPPRASFVSPSNGANLKNEVKVSIDASDNLGLSQVDFFVDNELVMSWTAPSFEFKWKTNRLKRGPHTLMCVAYDAAGNTTSTTITVIK